MRTAPEQTVSPECYDSVFRVREKFSTFVYGCNFCLKNRAVVFEFKGVFFDNILFVWCCVICDYHNSDTRRRGLNGVAISGRSGSTAEEGEKSVLLRDGFLVCMATCSVRSSGEAVLVCARIVVLDDPMMCPDVLEW